MFAFACISENMLLLKVEKRNFKSVVFSCMQGLKIVTTGKRLYLKIVNFFYELDVIVFSLNRWSVIGRDVIEILPKQRQAGTR